MKLRPRMNEISFINNNIYCKSIKFYWTLLNTWYWYFFILYFIAFIVSLYYLIKYIYISAKVNFKHCNKIFEITTFIQWLVIIINVFNITMYSIHLKEGIIQSETDSGIMASVCFIYQLTCSLFQCISYTYVLYLCMCSVCWILKCLVSSFVFSLIQLP